MWEDELEKEVMIWTSMDTNQKARTYMSLKRFIKSLLKEQREICADRIPMFIGKCSYVSNEGNIPNEVVRIKKVADLFELIENAPEPTGKK